MTKDEQTNEGIANGVFLVTWLSVNYTGKDDDKTKDRHMKFMHKKIVEALNSKDEQIARLSAEVEKLKHDKEIAFNVGVEQSNEIVTLTAHISLLVEGLEKIYDWKFDFRGDCVADARKVAKELLSSPPISHHIEIREAEKKVVEKAVKWATSKNICWEEAMEVVSAVKNLTEQSEKEK